MRRLSLVPVAATAVISLLAGCGGWQRVGEVDKPSPEREVTELFDPAGLYSRLGRIVGSGPISYVGSVAYVAGPADSSVAIVAVSLSNREFAFERSGKGFGARYRIEYQFDRAGASPLIISRDKTLLVSNFEETMRTDESIIEQQRVDLIPGNYTLTVRVRDLGTATEGNAYQRITVPVFGPGSYTAPLLVYQLRSRASRNDSLAVVLNPTGTVAYGGDTLLAYVEGYGFTHPVDLPVTVRDERDSSISDTHVHFSGNGGVESAVIRIAPDSAPLGRLDIVVGPDRSGASQGASPEKFAVSAGGDLAHQTLALVSFSSKWVVTNFDDLLSLLRYFGQDRRVEAMRRAKNSDRIALWSEFVKATDPDPSTPENEALDQYFGRIAIANQRYHETGRPGWRTDRGEVFIALGDPDEQHDQSAQLQNPLRFYIWQYLSYNLTLYFQDVTGFGRFELTPGSRSDFIRIRGQIQARQTR